MAADFVAGTLNKKAGVHRIGRDLQRSPLGKTQATMLTRFVEFWCSKNCKSAWRIEQSSSDIFVFFDTDRDTVLFKISEEFRYFETEEEASFI